MLKKLRITVAVVLFTLITFYFLDFATLLPNHFHILAHIQLVPAILSFSIGILFFLFLLTFFFGRIYCSVICPMGVFQDVIGRFHKKKKYTYTPPKNVLRWVIVLGVVLSFLVGFTLILSILDPYSAYGRMIVGVFKPVYMEVNNLLALLLTKAGIYNLYIVDVAIRGMAAFVIGLLTFLVIGFMAYKFGRTYCNTVCPVGTVLGFISKYSVFKIKINAEKCNSCGLCATKCKAACINSKEHVIDYSRCVACYNCLPACRKKALEYSFAPLKKRVKPEQESPVMPVNDGPGTDNSRRAFLATSVLGALAIPKAMARKGDALLTDYRAYEKKYPLCPPGSVSAGHLQKHCTACHLCVSKCPSNVLVPAFLEYGLGGMMQPRMSFEKGFCNFDCTVCTEVCPNGAILPLTVEEKHVTQVGKVVFVIDNCIVHRDGTSCGACSEHCPTQAVSMQPYKDGLTIPTIHTELCVGCGGCEYVCPVRPFRAIYIEGNAVQQQAVPFEKSEKKEVELDDFGF